MRRWSKAAIIAALALVGTTATANALATDDASAVGTHTSWARPFYSVDPFMLEGVSFIENGVEAADNTAMDVNFIRNGERIRFFGVQRAEGVEVDLLAPLVVGEYQVTLSAYSERDEPELTEQPVGEFLALSPFDIATFTSPEERIEVGDTTPVSVMLPFRATPHENFGPTFQAGLRARFVLPENVSAIDPETDEDVFGEISADFVWDESSESYWTQVLVRPHATQVDPVQVEVWQGDLQVGTPAASTLHTVGSMPAEIFVNPGHVSAGTSSMEVIDGVSGREANGVDGYQVDVHFSNEQGFPLALSDSELNAVELSASPASGVTFGPLEATSELGTYRTYVTSSSVGVKTINVSVDGTRIDARDGATDQALFVAGNADAAHSQMVTTPGAVVADGVQTHSVTVTVRDNADRPVANALVDFASDSQLIASVEGPYLTDSNGTVTVAYASKEPGTFQVRAFVAGAEVQGSPGSLVFEAAANGENPGDGEGSAPNEKDNSKESAKQEKPQTALASTGTTSAWILGIMSLLAVAGGAGTLVARRLR